MSFIILSMREYINRGASIPKRKSAWFHPGISLKYIRFVICCFSAMTSLGSASLSLEPENITVGVFIRFTSYTVGSNCKRNKHLFQL